MARKVLCLVGVVLFIACDGFFVDALENDANGERVFIDHKLTEYVSANPPEAGMTATKTNVLFFSIQTQNLECTAIEFFGRAILEEDPEEREHSIHFRTDTIQFNPLETGYNFNTLERISSNSAYSIVRCKFPTNEFYPFDGDKGKVSSITITKVWAIGADGGSWSVPFSSLN